MAVHTELILLPMPLGAPSDALVTGMLLERWGITAVPERVLGGASRNTWRVDGRFWLSHSDATEEAVFRREGRLLEALSLLLVARRGSWCVPRLIPALTGETTAVTHDGVWRLAQHLSGEALEMGDPDTYPKLARMLAEVHALLASVPRSLAVRDSGAVERTRAFVAAYRRSAFRPITSDPREAPSLGAIVGWLGPRIGALAALPSQLTHGDWTPPNIKVTPQGWGVLDWEFARVDPPEMDLAQSCSTILMWSGLKDPAEQIARLVDSYRVHSGRSVSVENVRASMAVYWLQNYRHWRSRQEAVGGFEDVLARQPGRLHAIAEFVGAL